jgi:hypothetical protein
MKAVSSSETSVNIYQTARRYISDESILCNRRRENVQSQTLPSRFKLLKMKSCHHLPVLMLVAFGIELWKDCK